MRLAGLLSRTTWGLIKELRGKPQADAVDAIRAKAGKKQESPENE